MKVITTPTDHISSASENGRPKIISGDLNVEDKCYIVHWYTLKGSLAHMKRKLTGKLLTHSSIIMKNVLWTLHKTTHLQIQICKWLSQSLLSWLWLVVIGDPPALYFLDVCPCWSLWTSSVHSTLWPPASTQSVNHFREHSTVSKWQCPVLRTVFIPVGWWFWRLSEG